VILPPNGGNLARIAPAGEWSTFERFVRSYGVDLLAERLAIQPSAVYHWLRGANAPRHTIATKIRLLARRRHVQLSLDQIYQHFEVVPKGGNDGPKARGSQPVESLRRRN
jgi:hypothetical protein